MTSDLLNALVKLSELLGGISPDIPLQEQYQNRLMELEGRIRSLENKTTRREPSDPEKYRELSELLDRYDETKAATETAFQLPLEGKPEGKPPRVLRVRLKRRREKMLQDLADLRLQTSIEREGLIIPPDPHDLEILNKSRAVFRELRELYSQLQPLIDVLSAASVNRPSVSLSAVDHSGLADSVSDQVVKRLDFGPLRQEIGARLDRTDQLIQEAVSQTERLGGTSVEHEVVVTHRSQLDPWLAVVLPLMNVVVFWFSLSLLSQRLTAVLLSGATALALIIAIALNVGVVWVISRLQVSDDVKTHQTMIIPPVGQSRRPQPP